MLIHIILSADDLSVHLPTVLSNLKTPPPAMNGPSITYNILTTIFNVSPSRCRLPIFQALLDLCKEYKLYDLVASKFKDVPQSLQEWGASPADSRSVYVKVAELCDLAETEQRATEYLIRAVETFTEKDDSKDLTITTINAVLNEEDRLIVDDLLVLQPVKALQQSSSAHFELLTTLANGNFAELKAFSAANESFFSTNSVSREIIDHKFKVLTIASLAARQDNRKLRYADIAAALEIADVEVELWIIEAIKSKLVEGKMSQPSAIFMVHRATNRTFEHEQWEEVSAKLASWKESLQGILEVIDNVKNDVSGGQPNGFSNELEEDDTRSQAPSELESIDENAD